MPFRCGIHFLIDEKLLTAAAPAYGVTSPIPMGVDRDQEPGGWKGGAHAFDCQK
jgi:hypothetical protein